MKKVISVLLCCVLGLSIIPQGVLTVAALQSGNYTYTVSGVSATITDFPMTVSGSIIIPDTISGFKVTSVGAYAFQDCTRLTSVTIPSSVTSIGTYAFSNCTGLTSVTIPSSVTSIGTYAFSSCTGLTSVTIPSSVTTIFSFTFYFCTGLTSVTIPSSVIIIGSYAFQYCTGLTSITIPSSVTSINTGAFYGCTGLTSVTIPSTVTHVGSFMFQYCTGLLSVTIPSSVFGYYSKVFDGCTGLTSVTIDSSVTSIDDYAFSDCTNLPSVTIPSSVTRIGNYAFSNCTGLTSVTIGSSVTSIGNYAFYNCTGLTSVTIPSSVTRILVDAFNGCKGLTSVAIPSSVTNIYLNAFAYCSKLTAAYFLGDAPNMSDPVFEHTASFKVYYISGKSGFSNPWYGYPTSTFILTPPTPLLNPSTTASTNGNVIVTITYSEDSAVKEYKIGVAGTWTAYNAPVVVCANDTIYARGINLAGNTSAEGNIVINNIDKIAPKITINSYITSPTNNDIIVTASTNEGSLNATTHTFTANGSFEFVATDLAGNVTKRTVTITNIDKVAPVITIAPYTTAPTNGDIIVTASTNEGSLNATTHTFTANGSFEFLATDLAGNVIKQTVTITNIDKTAPVIAIAPYTTTPINGDIIVTASTNEGSLNAITHTFTANGSFEFVATDLAGNITRKTVTITNIYKVSVPTGLIAVSASYNSIKLTWSAVTGATGYTIYRLSGSSYVYLASVSALTYTNTSLATGTKYYYKIYAYNLVNGVKVCSAMTSVVSAVPTLGLPSSFTVARYSTTSIKLSWAAVAGASGYTVYRSTSISGTYSYLVGTAQLSYINTGLTKNTNYYYKVAAYRMVGTTKVYGAMTAIKSAKPY